MNSSDWILTMLDEKDSEKNDFNKRFNKYCIELNNLLNNTTLNDALENLNSLLKLYEKEYKLPLHPNEINSLHPLLKEYLKSKNDFFKEDN